MVASGGIALFDDFGAVGVDLETLHDRYGGFIISLEGDGAVVRRPPVAAGLIHLFLGHKFGLGVVDRATAVLGQRA